MGVDANPPTDAYKSVNVSYRVHDHLLSNEDWMEDLHAADAIFVAAHSQGCIVATHLLDRLVRDGHILTSRSVDTFTKAAAAVVPGGTAPPVQAQRIGFLALCGIHLGPLRYLGTSSLLQPYIQVRILFLLSQSSILTISSVLRTCFSTGTVRIPGMVVESH